MIRDLFGNVPSKNRVQATAAMGDYNLFIFIDLAVETLLGFLPLRNSEEILSPEGS
jgi:hypothetical protein